jgi:protein-S-isoprenylcysteine O-methyltransferase Ste14
MFVAAALVLVVMLSKIRIEEKFMAEQFGSESVTYRRQVKALIPLVW